MTGPYAHAAWAYRQAGWVGVLPLPAGAKWPPPSGYTGWAGIDPSAADVQAWCDGPEGAGNIALRLPVGVYGLDVDAYSGKDGAAALRELVALYGPLPATWIVTSRDDDVSGIRLYRAELAPGRRWRDEPAGHGRGVEALHFGHRYAVTWPSVHPETGREYAIRGPAEWRLSPGGVPVLGELPWLPSTWVDGLSELGEVASGEAASHSMTLEAVNAFPTGDACEAMREAAARALTRLREARDGAALHPAGRDATHELTRLGHEGHAGARRALAEHFGAFVAVREARGGPRSAAEGEWWRLVRGAVGKLAGTARSTCDCALRAGVGVQFDWVDTSEEAQDTDVSGGEGGAGGIDRPTWGVPLDLIEEVQVELRRLRVRDHATEIHQAQQHAKRWEPPQSYGSLADELKVPDEDPQWRVYGLLGNGHNAVLVAGRKTGKTTMVNEFVRAYVDGGMFLGTQEVTTTGAAVAIFNYEVDERQYRRWLRAVGIENTHLVHVLHLRGKSLPLADGRVRAWVAAWLRDRGVGAWVVDPYSRAYVGSVQNGNDEAQVGAFLDALDVIKFDAGVDELVMPVHTPKARVEEGHETAIGSQRLEAWPDVLWYLTRDGSARFLRAEGRDVDFKESELHFDSATHRLKVELFGQDRKTARRGRSLEKLISFVHANPGCGVNQIRDALRISAAGIAELVAASAGRIVKEEGPNRAKLHFLREDVERDESRGTSGSIPPVSHSHPPGVVGGWDDSPRSPTTTTREVGGTDPTVDPFDLASDAA